MNLCYLSARRHPPAAIPGDLRAGDILGGTLIGCLPSSPEQASWPVQAVAAPLLGRTGSFVREQWATDGDCWSGEFEGIRYRRNREILFGVVELDEQAVVAERSGSGLQQATREAYSRLFRLLSAQELPHLWRVWNYLAEINDERDGLERYRHFNIGRYDAFVACGRASTGEVPAACTIGLRHGPLSIAFIAGHTPARAVENPRQVSAYHYPASYGPRSPTFSRAALLALPEQEILFVSGTASIVGHATVHAGDITGQCDETLDNVEAVIAEANRLSGRLSFKLPALSYRVYLRDDSHFPVVRDLVDSRLGGAEILYVQADICRRDLLVEIEAIAVNAAGST